MERMERSELFGKELAEFRCGLVRLSRELRIIDKNGAAKRLIGMPRRGASVLPVLGDTAERLLGLSMTPASCCVVGVFQGERRVNATAIREPGGSVLLLFHPLLSMMQFSDPDGKRRVPIHFIRKILDVLYDVPESGIVPKKISRDFSLIDFSEKRPTFTEEAMKRLAEKLGKTELPKKVRVSFLNRCHDCEFLVDMQTVLYSFAELLYIDAALSGKGEAEINVTADEKGMVLSLSDILKRRKRVSDENYLKLITSILLLADAFLETENYGERRLFVKITVPVKRFRYSLSEPEVLTEDGGWGYFLHAVEDYLTGMSGTECGGDRRK